MGGPDSGVGGFRRRIQRDAKFIQSTRHELLGPLRAQEKGVGIEKHVHPSSLEVPDDLRQLLVEKRFPYTVQDRPSQIRELIRNLLGLLQ